MKVLLDENLDHRLRKHLGSHEVFTASHMGWDGLKNGRLLEAAENDGFDVLITGDQTLSSEQNRRGRGLALIVLSAIEWRIIRDRVSMIAAAIDTATPGSVQFVDCGVFQRKRERLL